MKPIFVIQVPIEAKDNHTEFFENLRDYLSSDYYVLVYFDNRCEQMNFRLFTTDNFKMIEFDTIMSDFEKHIEENDMGIFEYDQKEFEQSIYDYIVYKLKPNKND